MNKIKYWLARNQDNLSEWHDMSILWLNVLIWYKAEISSPYSNVIGSRKDIAK